MLLGIQSGTATLEDSSVFFTNLNIVLPYSPAIMLLGIYPTDLKTCVSQKMNVYRSLIHNHQKTGNN